MNTSLLKTRAKFKLLSSDLPVLFLANKDRRTPTSTRVITALALVYLFSPIDIVPDVLPLLGWLDDLLVTPFLMAMAFKTVPMEVLLDAKARIQRTKHYLLVFTLLCVAAALMYIGYLYIGPHFSSLGDY